MGVRPEPVREEPVAVRAELEAAVALVLAVPAPPGAAAMPQTSQ
jgi:hypothetical protein